MYQCLYQAGKWTKTKKKFPGLMKVDPEKFKPDLQWMSSSPKGGVCGHGSGLDLSKLCKDDLLMNPLW